MNQNNDFHNKMIEKYGLPDWLPEGWVYKPAGNGKRSVYNHGENDVEFSVHPNIEGKQLKHKAYQIWASMLQRAYSDKYKEKYHTYLDVIVHPDWHIFSNFLVWFNNNYIEGWQLDKDILVKDNKVYSPDTCIFLPSEINLFITLSNNSRGLLPIGVTLHKGGFISRIGTGKSQKHLGCFDTKEEAHRAWQKAKLEKAIAFNFPPLQRVIDQLNFEVDNNIETIKL